jgi:hypothetical protein
MSRSLLGLAVCLTLAGSASSAHAVAHHKDVVLQKLRGADGKVNGFRLHAVLVPETYRKVRLNIGRMQHDPGAAQHDRLVAAGISPGYVKAQIGEFDVSQMQGAGGLYEVKLDVHYGVMNDLKPGEKIDLYSTHSSTGGNSYWHVYGMFRGPAQSGDNTHVHELPSDTSAHAEASDTP